MFPEQLFLMSSKMKTKCTLAPKWKNTNFCIYEANFLGFEWDSFVPKSFKRGIVRCLLYRAEGCVRAMNCYIIVGLVFHFILSC